MVLGSIHPQEHLVVVVFVPVEGEDPGSLSVWVPTEQGRHNAHQLAKGAGTTSPEQRIDYLQKVLGAVPLKELEVERKREENGREEGERKWLDG